MTELYYIGDYQGNYLIQADIYNSDITGTIECATLWSECNSGDVDDQPLLFTRWEVDNILECIPSNTVMVIKHQYSLEDYDNNFNGDDDFALGAFV